MNLRSKPLEKISPNIGHVRIENYDALLELANDTLGRARSKVSGVISDGSGQGELIERNTLKQGRMVYFEREPTDARVAAFYDFVLARCRDYLQGMVNGSPNGRRPPATADPADITMERSWVIDQRENDYQYLHCHIPNLLSGIIYLDVPESINPSTYPDGILTLIETNPFVILPAAGDMYIWPSYMLHVVYPYRQPGRRLAISFNVMDRKRGYEAAVYFQPTYVQTTRDLYFRSSPLARNFE